MPGVCIAPVSGEFNGQACVEDAMLTCPKTLGPNSSVGQVRAFFRDDHVHVALIVQIGRAHV